MRRRSVRITIEMVAVIKLLVIRLHFYQHEAAAIFGINQGRVSEIITGKRFADVPMATTLPPGLI